MPTLWLRALCPPAQCSQPQPGPGTDRPVAVYTGQFSTDHAAAPAWPDLGRYCLEWRTGPVQFADARCGGSRVPVQHGHPSGKTALPAGGIAEYPLERGAQLRPAVLPHLSPLA
ncbi:hypothetical protein D3C76_1336040 [compost metagenome]